MQLIGYFRSSAAFRVRIALHLKGIKAGHSFRHLRKGEHRAPDYVAINPQKLVPALMLDSGEVLTQSMAILEYLEETHPEPPLLPKDAAGRARVRAIALDIACEIHPLDNLRVLRYLVKEMGLSEEAKDRWYRHWVETGLETVERQLAGNDATGRFCHGDRPGLADCVLVPQIHNAQRMNCRLDHVPTVMRVYENCMAEAAFSSWAKRRLSVTFTRGCSDRRSRSPPLMPSPSRGFCTAWLPRAPRLQVRCLEAPHSRRMCPSSQSRRAREPTLRRPRSPRRRPTSVRRAR